MAERSLTFRKLNDEALAKELMKKLDANQIFYEVEDNYKSVDQIYLMDILREIRIKLMSKDFQIAQQTIEGHYKELVDDVEKDYYLFDFSNQELTEIVMKPDEWGDFDYQLAQKILRDRGVEIKPAVAELLKKQRIDDLTKPETSNRYVLYVGYASALLGGFLGIAIGYHLSYSKKTLPDGKSLYRYTEAERDHGTRILLIGTICFAGWVLYQWRLHH